MGGPSWCDPGGSRIYRIHSPCPWLERCFLSSFSLSGGEQAANELCGFLISPSRPEPPRKRSDTSELGLPAGTPYFDSTMAQVVRFFLV